MYSSSGESIYSTEAKSIAFLSIFFAVLAVSE